MASTNKTQNLGLNSWTETDRPKRVDFQSDNDIIDQKLGEHIKSTAMHLTQEEKARATSPFSAVGYSGNGSQNQVVTLPFAPKMVYVFKKSSPTLEYNTAGYMVLNSGIGLPSGSGSTGGINISDNMVQVSQSSAQSGGSFYNLNASGGQYAIIAFR